MSARVRCRRHVYSGARSDFSGHRCRNLAQEGSDFCHLHQEGRALPEPPEEQTYAAVEPETRTRRTSYASMDWEPGEGPLVRPPYRKVGLGYVTHLGAKKVDDNAPTVGVRGVLQKKDGTPGVQPWDVTWGADRVVPADLMDQLLAALEREATTDHRTTD